MAARKWVGRSACRLATAISSFRPRRATRENGVGIPCLQEWCLSCREYREGVVNEYLRAKAGACGYEIVPDAIALAGRSGGPAKPRATPSCPCAPGQLPRAAHTRPHRRGTAPP